MFATVALVLIPVTEGERFSVRLRVTFQRKPKYFPLKKYCLKEQWDAKAQRFNKTFPDYKKENEILQTFHQRASDLIWGYHRDGVPFAFDRFERDFTGHDRGGSVLLWALTQEYGEALKKQGKLGNSLIYLAVAKVVKRYSAKAALRDVNLQWLRRLEMHMRTNRNLRDGGIAVHMKTISAVCNRAIDDGIMPEGWKPFKGFEIARLKTTRQKLALPKADILRFASAEGLSDRLQLSVDLFLFSFYTRGMNMADIAELSKANIQGDRIIYTRKKTGDAFNLKITPMAQRILDKYHDAGRDWLFPILDPSCDTPEKRYKRCVRAGVYANMHLKEVAAMLGMSTDIVFYTARHTYATALKNEGVPIEMISELLGHETILTTRAYLKAFEASALDMADERLHGATG